MASDININISEDTVATVTLSATDLDNDPLNYTIASFPLHGELSGTAPDLIYTPPHNYNGPDSFTYKAIDNGSAESNIATVSITVNPVNDAPVADNKNILTNENTAVDVILTATDPENDPLTYAVVTNPSHGTLSGTPPNLAYTPAANYSGADSFTYKVTDNGGAESNIATVSITVNPVNDAPVADNKNILTNENTAVDVTLTATDPENDPLTYSVVTNPSHGTISGTPPNSIYTPAANYSGADSFTYKAIDNGGAESNIATVSITVNPVNDAPVADNKNIATNEDTAAEVTLTATDPENDPLTYAVVTNPSHGTLSGTPPNLAYTPAANYSGADSITYKAVDNKGAESNIATVSITVNPVNDAPVAGNKNIITNEDTAAEVTLTATDPENDPLTYSTVTNPSHGTLSGTKPNLIYTPAANYSGADSFTYKATDNGGAESNIATVSITVNLVNDAPVADNKNVATNEDTAVGVTLTATDPENDPLTYSIVTNPSHGTLSGTPPNSIYTPAANYNGADSFTYKAIDNGSTDSNIATVSITVNPVNDAPVVSNIPDISFNEGKSITTAWSLDDYINDVDTPDSNITWTFSGNTQISVIMNTNRTVTFSAPANWNGNETITFTASDGQLSGSDNVNVTVNPVNDIPVQLPIGDKEVYKGQLLSFGITATDADSDPITYGTSATKGVLDNNTGAYTWTPGDGDAGKYVWVFNSSDNHGGIVSETINVTVRNPLELDLILIEPYMVKDNNGTWVEMWREASVGHKGKFIGYNSTFKNMGVDSMTLTITESFNNKSNSPFTVTLAKNDSRSCPDGTSGCRLEFEIDSIDRDRFNFTLQINVKGYNGSNFIFSYDNVSTIFLQMNPISRIIKRVTDDKGQDIGIVVVKDASTSTMYYTLEANSSINLKNVSIYDPFFPSDQNPIPVLEAGKPDNRTYTYSATTSDLSKYRCGEPYGSSCIINMATFTAKNESGYPVEDSDYVRFLLCKDTDTACLQGFKIQENRLSTSSSGSGGGGGGGGGLPPSEDFKNIERREVREMDVFARSASAYVFRSADPVMAVSFESSVSENGVPVAVEILKNRSKSAGTDAPGIVYRNFNVFAGTSGFSKKISNGVVIFKVNNSWLEENGLSPEDIILYKWQGGDWVEKSTEIAESRPNQTYYASLVGNFSSFSIAGVKKQKAASASGPDIPSGRQENYGDLPGSGIVKPPVSFNYIIGIIPLIGMIGLIYYLKIKSMKNNKMK